jgi:hypothetical protein
MDEYNDRGYIDHRRRLNEIYKKGGEVCKEDKLEKVHESARKIRNRNFNAEVQGKKPKSNPIEKKRLIALNNKREMRRRKEILMRRNQTFLDKVRRKS